MKVYVWRDVGHVSAEYHCGGGLMVVAQDLRRARRLIADAIPPKCADADWCDGRCEALTAAPDVTMRLAEPHDPQVIVFPNAGCC